MNSKLQDELERILGQSASHNINNPYQVPKEVSYLCQAVVYLEQQLKLQKRHIENEETKEEFVREYNNIMSNTKKILENC